VTLTTFYERQFAPLKLRSRSDNTKRLYQTTLRNFAKFLCRAPTLRDFSDETVSRFLGWLRERGRSPYTVNKERSNVLAMWRFACRKNLVHDWPDVEPDVEPERVPVAWTEGEVLRLFRCVQTVPGRVGQTPASAWWLALLLVCWDTGERIGGVIHLLWRDVDLVGGWVLSPAEIRKGKKADRLYKLAADTVTALRAIRPARVLVDDPVFPWPYGHTYLWDAYGRLLRRAGLPHDSRSKFHRIRRSVASYYEAAGGNATELLGHSCRRVTKRYLDPRIVERRFAVDLLFRPLH